MEGGWPVGRARWIDTRRRFPAWALATTEGIELGRPRLADTSTLGAVLPLSTTVVVHAIAGVASLDAEQAACEVVAEVELAPITNSLTATVVAVVVVTGGVHVGLLLSGKKNSSRALRGGTLGPACTTKLGIGASRATRVQHD